MRFYEKTADDPGQPGYLSLFIRRSFQVRNLEEIKQLIFRVDYDDGFIAYLNGKEIARANLEGTPRYNTKAKKGHEAGDPEDFDITDKLKFLKPDGNVLAIQVHNDKLTSNDLTMIPQLIQRTKLDLPPIKRIRNIDSLQQLIHTRGIYSRRQLQAVLAEFWENHFTTDYDKLVEYLEDLENSNGNEAMSSKQAKQEAAQMEWREYEFFHENALGYFGNIVLTPKATGTSQYKIEGCCSPSQAGRRNPVWYLMLTPNTGDKGFVNAGISWSLSLGTGNLWALYKCLGMSQFRWKCGRKY